MILQSSQVKLYYDRRWFCHFVLVLGTHLGSTTKFSPLARTYLYKGHWATILVWFPPHVVVMFGSHDSRIPRRKILDDK
jgi:hypothetical protein